MKNRIATILKAILAFVLLFVFLNYFQLRQIIQHESLSLVFGEFYRDRYFNLALVKTAMEYGYQYLEPIGRNETIVYQFSGFWLLAKLANLFSTDAATIMTIALLLMRPALVLSMTAIAVSLGAKKSTALIASIIAFYFVGFEEQFFGNKTYGVHAVIMPVARQFAGPYLDSIACVIGYMGTASLLHTIQKTRSLRQIPPQKFLVFVVLSALSFVIHYLSALFFITLNFAFIASSILTQGSNQTSKKFDAPLLLTVAVSHFCLLLLTDFLPPMRWFAIWGAILWSYCFWRGDRSHRVLLIGFVLTIVPMGILIYDNYAAYRAAYADLQTYNENVRQTDLTVPFFIVMASFFPLWIGIARSVWSSKRFERAILLSGFAVCLAATFNAHVGYNNHPYRFLAFSLPILGLWGVLGLFQFAAFSMRTERFRAPVMVCAATMIVLVAISNVRGWQTNRLHWFTQSPPFPSQIMQELAKFIDDSRQDERDSVFFVDRSIVETHFLASYTGAHFYYDSHRAYAVPASHLDDLLRDGSPQEIVAGLRGYGGKFKYLVTRVDLAEAGMKPKAEGMFADVRGFLYALKMHNEESTLH